MYVHIDVYVYVYIYIHTFFTCSPSRYLRFCVFSTIKSHTGVLCMYAQTCLRLFAPARAKVEPKIVTVRGTESLNHMGCTKSA